MLLLRQLLSKRSDWTSKKLPNARLHVKRRKVRRAGLPNRKPGPQTKRIFDHRQGFVEELPFGAGSHKEISAMKVRPLHDRILLKRIEEKDSIKGESENKTPVSPHGGEMGGGIY